MSDQEAFIFKLSQTQKAGLLRLAATETVRQGRRVTMSDLLRDSVDTMLSIRVEDADSRPGKPISFRPLPAVDKAIRRAAQNSGKPISDILNAAVMQAFEMEGVR